MSEMTVVQAIHELQLISRTFKSLAKLEEAMEVAAEFELREASLKKSILDLEKDAKDMQVFMEKSDSKFKELVETIRKKQLEADTIIDNAKKIAEGITDVAKKEADKMIKMTNANLLETTKAIEVKRVDLNKLSDEYNGLLSQKRDLQSKMELEKKRLMESLGAL